MDLASLPAFLIAVVLISASPGPAMALILRRSALHGYRAAVPTVLGLEAGLYLWALAAAAGFATLVAASQVAFVVLKVVGAVVLVVMGIQSWRHAWSLRRERGAAAELDLALPAPPTPNRGRSFGEGLAVQVANPKAAVFMIAFYPQFVPPDRNLFATTAVLALFQIILETGLYLGLAAGVGRARAWFARSAVRRRLEYVSGAVLIALGLRVASASQ
ncbi:MAG TPA: LysE family translocator [Acidimicrobiia bacterium]|nr:LysE family translocator [Acidimicrobiia bacterium]